MAAFAKDGASSIKASARETSLKAAAPPGAALPSEGPSPTRQSNPYRRAISAPQSLLPQIGEKTAVRAEQPQPAESETRKTELAPTAPQKGDPVDYLGSSGPISAAAADEPPIVMPPQERIWRSVWSVTRGEIGWLQEKLQPLVEAGFPEAARPVERGPLDMGGPVMERHFGDEKTATPKDEPPKTERNSDVIPASPARGDLSGASPSPAPSPQTIIDAITPLPLGLEALATTSGPDLHRVMQIHLPAAEDARPTPPTLPMQIFSAMSEASGPIMEVRLRPEELGHLRIEMRQDGDRFVMTLSAERPETLDLLRRHSSELAQDLRNSGHGALDLNFGPWARQDENGTPAGDEAAVREDGSVRDRRVRRQDSPLVDHPAAAPGGLYLRI